jgi:hypothetical protein
VLFGFISFFIIAWYVENDFLKKAGIPFRLFFSIRGNGNRFIVTTLLTCCYFFSRGRCFLGDKHLEDDIRPTGY